jgi:hypothetical protein
MLQSQHAMEQKIDQTKNAGHENFNVENRSDEKGKTTVNLHYM